jgi:hypothetical protein
MKAPPELALTASSCPACGVLLAVPAFGIDRTSFILFKILQFAGFAAIYRLMGEAGFLMIPVAIGVSIWLAISRLDNIGLSRWLSACVLIPWVFTIYLACAATGSGRLRRSKAAPLAP